MASIGEVSATLKADIGQYVGPMQQAAQATAQVQQSVETATTALLKEGAAGEAAGKGLASFGASTTQLAQQLAAAEGRLSQLTAAFTTLGIAPVGKEFAKASADVARLRAELQSVAPAAAQAAQATSQVVPATSNIARAGMDASKGLLSMRGSLANLASSAAGVPGPLGNIASKLLVFGAGGPVTVALLAGLAVIGSAFSKWRETVQRESDTAAETWERTLRRMRDANKFIDLIEEQEEATKRLRQAQEDLASAQQTTRTVEGPEGPVTVQTPIDPQRVAVATLALSDAQRALAAVKTAIAGVRHEIHQTTEELADEARQLEEQHKREFVPSKQLAEAKANAEKTTTALHALKAELDAIADHALEIRTEEAEKRLQQLQEQFDRIKESARAIDPSQVKAFEELKGNTSLKDRIRQSGQGATEVARSLGQSLSRALGQGFVEGADNLGSLITNALKQALAEAIAAVVESAIFRPLIDALGKAFKGGESDGGGGGLIGNIVGGIVGGLLATPSLPAPESVMGPSMGAIIVPLENLPPPRSAIEYARDDLHRQIWVETARAAQANGVNLQPRFR